MDSNGAGASQKKMRKSLRYRPTRPPLGWPTKDKPMSKERTSKKPKLEAPTKSPSIEQTASSDSNVDRIEKPSITAKRNCVKSNQNATSKPANENDSSKPSIKEPVLSGSEPKLNDRVEDPMNENHPKTVFDSNDHRNENDDNRSEISSVSDNHKNVIDDSQSKVSSIGHILEKEGGAEDFDSEDSKDNCFEEVLKEVNKDIGALYSKTNKIEADLKEIKQILLARPSQHCIRTISSRFNQKRSFSLLPKFPLEKKSAVRNMDANAEDEENEEYKDQLVMKLASYGGDTVNEIVINIFKNLFTNKLKTKYCWKGTTKGKGKCAFKRLKGIREAIWSAVTIHFKDCTEATISKQIKLRLNQAQKDFDRELIKQNGVK